ncbi:hypothetical protein ERO13_D01G183820v2 [Gossypium hirsutum]|nr:hypothetical protein ERO13_D01G183820v2 [Gossypium hirsutum]
MNPTPSDLSFPTLHRQCVSCLISHSGDSKNRLPQSIVEGTSCSQKLMPFHKPLLQPRTRQRYL